MLEIDLLKQSLTGGETLGVETLDPRFQDIASTVEAGEFVKAAEQVEGLIREGAYDIRLIGYYLYGVLLERGLPGLDDILVTLTGLLGDNWGAIGPARKKEMHTNNALLWLFSRVLKKLEGEEQKKGPDWNAWTRDVSSDAADGMLERLTKFRRSLSVVGDDIKCADSLQKIDQWLKAFQKMVYVAAPEPAAEEAPPADAAEEVAAGTEAAGGRGAAPAAPAAGGMPGFALQGGVALPPPGASAMPIVEGSARLVELLRKIDKFDELVKKDDVLRASVVAADITQTLDAFDPRLYFPKMFVKFYTGFAPNADRIAEAWGMREAPGWKAMEMLYRVDLDAFSETEMSASPMGGGGGGGGGGGQQQEEEQYQQSEDGSGM